SDVCSSDLQLQGQGRPAIGSQAGVRASRPGTTPRRGSRRRPALSRAGRAFSREMRLGKIRGRTTKHFHFLFEEFVPLAKLTKLSILGPGDTGFLALFDAFFSEPFIERANVNTEVLRDLRECHFWAAIQRDLYDVVTELS